ncbi:uncharacterized protein [Henckelia pumila]|uniref:uncharacterized protein n=1 Tax=Henckelia pumila TaxID=405737 RepID=UPI003C6E498B
MLRMCSQHNLTQSQQTQTFYNGVDPSVRSMQDFAASGSLFRKTPADAWEIIGNMAESNVGCPDLRKEKIAGVLEVDALIELTAKIDALTHQMTQMHSTHVNHVQGIVVDEQLKFESETANSVGNQGRQPYNSYKNTYNSGWQNQPKKEEKKPCFEEIMMNYVAVMETRLQNQEAMLQKLENQMDQLETQLLTRAPGSYPSNSEKNPRDVNAIMVVTRSQGEEPEKRAKGKEAKRPNTEESREDKHSSAKPSTTGKKGKNSDSDVHVNVDISTLPFPQRDKMLQFDYQFKFFFEIFKKLHINIPFEDVLAQMPSYARFLKNILKNKRKLNDIAQVTLNEECSIVLQNKLPPKFKDPGGLSIPCKIWHLSFDNVLCDLGESIILMSYALAKKLGIRSIEPASISLKFAD